MFQVLTRLERTYWLQFIILGLPFHIIHVNAQNLHSFTIKVRVHHVAAVEDDYEGNEDGD